MQNVTNKAGPQPISCPMDDCSRPPYNDKVGEYCQLHKDFFDRQNGTAHTPPIQEPDDPVLIERTRRVAEAQEAQEYRDRRRVKTWKTLENGTRIPDELYSDEEFAVIEAEAERMAQEMAGRMAVVKDSGVRPPFTREMHEDVLAMRKAMWGPRPDEGPDPVKEATKLFKAALKGKLGDNAMRMAWSLSQMLEDL